MYRRRRNFGPFLRSRRPVDKVVINENTTLTNTQSNNTVYSAAVACTFSGARIVGTIMPNGTGNGIMALVHVRQGSTISTLSVTDGSSPYTPEQNILWLKPFTGVGGSTSGPITLDVTVNTKRKMLTGDQIVLCHISNIANMASDMISVTCFIKQ